MISHEELRRKAMKDWESGAFLSSALRGESRFPLEIRFATPSGRKLAEEYQKVRDWIAELKKESREAVSHGYRIEYKSVAHRMLGSQEIPDRIWFETENDWLCYIGKKTDFLDFKRLAAEILARQPRLAAFLMGSPHTVLTHREAWPGLLSVCEWFQADPRPGLYLRQLSISGVDTKFMESKKGLLWDLLGRVLPSEAQDPSVTGLSKHGFERRFGLAYDPPLLRLRLLDPACAVSGLTDLTLPLADAAGMEFGAETIYITENKVNGLAFPKVEKALILFGLGYGIEMLSRIPWLRDKKIFYWGDLDTHGFSILSRLRGYFPQVRSFLMDAETLFEHRPLWGKEPSEKRFAGALSNLTPEEQDLYAALRDNRFGSAVRLEQERIAFSWLLRALQSVMAGMSM